MRVGLVPFSAEIAVGKSADLSNLPAKVPDGLAAEPVVHWRLVTALSAAVNARALAE